MSNHQTPRQPPGQPAGGQFAAASRPSSGLNLEPLGPPPATVDVTHEDLATYSLGDTDGLLGYDDGTTWNGLPQPWLTHDSMTRLATETQAHRDIDNEAAHLYYDEDRKQWMEDGGLGHDTGGRVAVVTEGRGPGNERLYQLSGWDFDDEDDWDDEKVAELTQDGINMYVTTAMWSSHDDDGDPFDNREGELSDESREIARSELTSFLDDNQAAIRAAQASQPGYDMNSVANDYWLTRNGHGAGFWDRGLGDAGDKLSEAAAADGGQDVIVGDDGLLHFE